MSSQPTGAPQQSPPPLPPAPGPWPRPPKSPGLAALLSLLFPGVGQVYNGQPSKAVVFFFVFVAAIYGTAEIDPLPFAFLIPFTFLFNIVDAYRSADAINMRHAGGEPVVDEDGIESPVWGGALVVLGLVLLLNNLGWLPVDALRRFWPVALIVVGGVLLWGSFRRREVPDAETAKPDTAVAGDGDPAGSGEASGV